MRHLHCRSSLFAVAFAAVVVLTACGGSEEAGSSASAPSSQAPTAEPSSPAATESSPSPTAADETALSDAEVQFLQGMIPHHQSAIEMAQLVPERTERPQLRELSEAIVASQEAEIDQMRRMLTEAGEDPHAMSGMGMDMGDDSMTEMMDPPMMTGQLERLQGQEFDLAFVELMIMHHEGAVQMSEMVLEQGADGQVAALAEAIIQEQRAEIEQMREWQRAWS